MLVELFKEPSRGQHWPKCIASQGAFVVKRLCRVPPHVFESETNVSRNEIRPRELWLLKGYAEYRRVCLSPKLMLIEMKSASGSFGC